MKKAFLVSIGLCMAILGKAQSISEVGKDTYMVVGVNLAPLVANQIQFDAEFGRKRTSIAWVGSVFYGQLGAYQTQQSRQFISAQTFGIGAGFRMYETALEGTRFFVQPGLYYKSLAINYEVMKFIPYTFDGLPAQRWGAAIETDEYRGVVGELLAGTQSFIGSIVIEGGIGFVFRNLNPLQQTQNNYDTGAILLLGLGEFSPVAQFKLGYKF